jgi:hypothetical protein
MQCGEQRTGLHLKRPPRNLLDPPRDAQTVHLFESESLQDHEIERALQKVRLFRTQVTSPIDIRWETKPMTYRMSTGKGRWKRPVHTAGAGDLCGEDGERCSGPSVRIAGAGTCALQTRAISRSGDASNHLLTRGLVRSRVRNEHGNSNSPPVG